MVSGLSTNNVMTSTPLTGMAVTPVVKLKLDFNVMAIWDKCPFVLKTFQL